MAELACLAAAIWKWRKGQGAGGKPKVSGRSVGGTLAFAVGSTLTDLPTALPYFAAVSQMPRLVDDCQDFYV